MHRVRFDPKSLTFLVPDRGALFALEQEKVVVMTVQFFKRSVPPVTLDVPMPTSGLVRRLLLRSHDDAAKRRIPTCMLALDDARLLTFGLTPEDIVILRTTAREQRD